MLSERPIYDINGNFDSLEKRLVLTLVNQRKTLFELALQWL